MIIEVRSQHGLLLGRFDADREGIKDAKRCAREHQTMRPFMRAVHLSQGDEDEDR